MNAYKKQGQSRKRCAPIPIKDGAHPLTKEDYTMFGYLSPSSKIQKYLDYLIVDLNAFPQTSLEGFLSQTSLSYQPDKSLSCDELGKLVEVIDAL